MSGLRLYGGKLNCLAWAERNLRGGTSLHSGKRTRLLRRLRLIVERLVERFLIEKPNAGVNLLAAISDRLLELAGP